MIAGCCIWWPKECKAIRLFISQADLRGDLKSTLAFNTHLVFSDLYVCHSFSRLVFVSVSEVWEWLQEADNQVQACISVLYLLREVSVCASRCVNSNYSDFLSFGLLLSPPCTHMDTHKRIHATHKFTQRYRDVHSPTQTIPGTSKWKGQYWCHRPPTTANEYSAVHCTSFVCLNTNKLLVSSV